MPAMTRIMDTIVTLQGGDRVGARQAFGEIWKGLAPEGNALARCVLSHYMADAQDDPQEELRWDLLALEASTGLTDEALKRFQASLTRAAFLPSLHLNVAADYLKLGDRTRASEHAQIASELAAALPNTDLARTTRGAIARVLAEAAA
jgi:hypothetical protein